jgi:hypothetical protein
MASHRLRRWAFGVVHRFFTDFWSITSFWFGECRPFAGAVGPREGVGLLTEMADVFDEVVAGGGEEGDEDEEDGHDDDEFEEGEGGAAHGGASRGVVLLIRRDGA